MSQLSKYEKNIKQLYNIDSFENISESSKSDLSRDIIELTMLNIEGQNFTNYLSCLKAEEIIPFNIIVKSITGNTRGTGSSNLEGFENIIASIAIVGLWKSVLEDFKKKALSENIKTESMQFYVPILGSEKQKGIEELVEILKKFNIQLNIDKNKRNYVDEYVKVLKFIESLNSDEDEAEKERRKTLKSTFSGVLDGFTKNFLTLFEKLYATGFTGFPQAGLYIPQKDSSPLVYINNRKNTPVIKEKDGGVTNDFSIFTSIASAYPVYNNVFFTKNEEIVPTLEKFYSGQNSPFVCMQLHLQFQSANIYFSSGKTSIRKWIKETKGMDLEVWNKEHNNNARTLQKWKDVEAWYTWALDQIFLDALMQYNKDNEYLKGSLTETPIVIEISKVITAQLSNVIVVAERDNKFSKIELRISNNNGVDIENIRPNIERLLNIGNSFKINIKQKENSTPELLYLDIILNPEEANKSNLFAGDVIDRFIASGNIPSWGHALIGKKPDGSLFFWDGFKDPNQAGPSNRCYTIYASSRSGKGVMTSTLVASAICDDCEVFYTDAKPENGATLGLISWKQGKEAYVFDGSPENSLPFDEPLENYTNGMRAMGESLKYLPNIPQSFANSGAFSKKDFQKLLGVNRYLKSLALCARIISGRATGVLPMTNWQVWVFDEVTNMANVEKEVRNCFSKYCLNKNIPFLKKTVSGEVDQIFVSLDLKKINSNVFDKNSIEYDEGITYIRNWLAWVSSVMSQILTANIISLGKADTNLIFIFQEPTWLSSWGPQTAIGSIVKGLKSTKIVGRGGIVDGAGEYGDGTIKDRWRTEIDIPGACNWAMSHGSDIRKSEVTLFKPFNIWTVPMDGKKIKTTPISDEEAVRYLEGYLNKLLLPMGKNPSDIINSAYEYANNAAKTLGLLNIGGRKNIRDYIYDCVNFEVGQTEKFEHIISEMLDKEDEQQEVPDFMEDTVDEPENGESIPTYTDENNSDGEENNGSADTESDNTEPDNTESIFTPEDKNNRSDNNKLEIIKAKYDSRYLMIINSIENSKERLVVKANKENKEDEFNVLKNELLRHFEGKFLIDRQSFINTLKKEIMNEELCQLAVHFYNSKFDKDYQRLYDEINNLIYQCKETEKENTDFSFLETDFEGSFKSIEHDIQVLREVKIYDKSIQSFKSYLVTLQNNLKYYKEYKEIKAFFKKIDGLKIDDAEKQKIYTEYTAKYEERINQIKVEVSSIEYVGPQNNNGNSKNPPKPIEDGEKPLPIPEKKNILNNQRLTSQIDTGNLRYNPQNVDSMGNVKASKQLTDQVIKDIIIQFGGANNIDSIAITASGCLVLNDYVYCPQFPDIFMDSLGMAIRNDLENGKLHRVVNLGYVVFTIMNQCVELTIESPKIANSTVFKNELRVKRSYGDLFKRNPNLQVIRLPNEELTRNNPNEQDNTGGLGSKLAGLFGFGRQNNKSDDYVPNPTASSNDNGFVDRMFESKPVRVLTGALGWTLGCKAVILAATFFGPWGLLFGAFAAAGAYKEIKNDRNRYNSSSTGGSRSSRKNGNGGRGSGVNSGRNRNNGGNGSRKNSQYDDEDF